MRRVAAGVQAAVALADPLGVQGYAALQAVRRELGSGVHVWPDPAPVLERISAPVPPLIKRFLPANLRVFAAVFDDDGGLWASLVLEVRKREITLISTSDMLEPLDLAGKTRDEQAALMLERFAERRGPADVGLFCDRQVLMHLARAPRPVHALARLARLGWVRLDPCPARFRLALRYLPLLMRLSRPGRHKRIRHG